MNARKKGSRGTGAALLVAAVVAFIIYAYALFGTQYSTTVIKFTVLGAVGVLLAVLGWIGYTMLTAPREDPEAAL
jgi:threonine/homoserine/homoserine lactone efflux protein